MGLGGQVGLSFSDVLWKHSTIGIHAAGQGFIEPQGLMPQVQVYQGVGSLGQGIELGIPGMVLGVLLQGGYGIFLAGPPKNWAGTQGYGALGLEYKWEIFPGLRIGAQALWGLLFEAKNTYSLPSFHLTGSLKLWEFIPPPPVAPKVDPPKILEKVTQLRLVDSGTLEGRRVILWGSFKENSTELTPRFQEQLPHILEYLQALEGLGSVEVQGFVADDGSGVDGRPLSQKRSEAVLDILKKALPQASWTWTHRGMGKANPIGDNRTPEGRDENRRIELVLHEMKKPEEKK